nr:probable methyltransferase PMT11 [Ipomoea batatas]
MKGEIAGEVSRFSTAIKIAAFLFVAVVFFYAGTLWSNGPPQQLLFFGSRQNSSSSPGAGAGVLSPNSVNSSDTATADDQQEEKVSAAIPPVTAVLMTGVVDDDGVMTDDFKVGKIEGDWVDNWEEEDEIKGEKIVVKKFEVCPDNMSEYIPCLDNTEAVKTLNSTEKGEEFERHCPSKGLNCLVWFSNVPHERLVEDKGGQNWIARDNDKFRFPGGGTQFIHGANEYLDQIQKMVPEIAFGNRTRVALDVGCGVASFGAYFLSRNVLPLSISPKDQHENQIQFALERGVPAMVATFATRRLLYPSQAFDLIHCSRCQINWTRDDGILLLEANRMLRAGGYFVWSAQPVYKHEVALGVQWEEMVNLTTRICWKLVKKEGTIAIWQKPLNNSCYLSRGEGSQPPLCDPNDDPDNIWYVDLKACITQLPEEGYAANVSTGPERLHYPSDRLKTIQLDAHISREELVRAESRYWRDIVKSYIQRLGWDKFQLRNVLDMRAGFGGFAEALINNKLDCWVLNVVPVSGPNTLPVIYDRGLIGVMHDWCEPFDTYPRTYDLLHANGLFSIERKRCNVSTIMLEMDRVLRPGGKVYVRDVLRVMDELEEVGKAVGWEVSVEETSEGLHASYRVLTAEKKLK